MSDQMDHRFYVDWGVEDIEKGLNHLQESADVSGNALVKGVIDSVQRSINVLKRDTGNQID